MNLHIYLHDLERNTSALILTDFSPWKSPLRMQHTYNQIRPGAINPRSIRYILTWRIHANLLSGPVSRPLRYIYSPWFYIHTNEGRSIPILPMRRKYILSITKRKEIACGWGGGLERATWLLLRANNASGEKEGRIFSPLTFDLCPRYLHPITLLALWLNQLDNILNY